MVSDAAMALVGAVVADTPSATATTNATTTELKGNPPSDEAIHMFDATPSPYRLRVPRSAPAIVNRTDLRIHILQNESNGVKSVDKVALRSVRGLRRLMTSLP